MRIKKLLPALGALVLVAGYAPRAFAQEDSVAAEANSRDITITVENRNWLDVRVYAVSSSQTRRLGTVTGLGEATFTLPRTLLGANDLQLAIRPIGQRGVYYSMPILVSPGDYIEFRVENHLALSSAIVY